MTLLIMIGLIQGGLRKSNGWFYILAPAVGMRCIPPIAFLISHFVMVELVEQYVPTFRTSIWLIVAFHSISALPLALLIVVPRLNRLHTPNTNEGGLFDMAQMDGLSAGTYFAHILFPNLRSEFLLAGLMAFSVSWSESLYAGVFQNGRENWTMPVFIAAFETSYQIAWAQLFASMAASIFVLVALAVVSVRLLNYELHLD
jgi:ABC-type glycerol-3-phosphate transport system permease component